MYRSRGTLTSRAQYLLDVGRYGYQDARLSPHGHMSAEDCIYWTWAIGNVDGPARSRRI